VEQELRETKIRSDKAMRIMNEIVANCEYLKEMSRNELHDEWMNDQVLEEKEKKKNSKKREKERITNAKLAQIYSIEKYTQSMTVPRNEQELIEVIQGMD
jgi:hypothetical protein